MSLLEKLNSAATESKSKLCKIGVLLNSPELDAKTKENLEAVLNVPESNPSRIPNTTLGRILREEGYDISNSTVDRHRREECSCRRLAKN